MEAQGDFFIKLNIQTVIAIWGAVTGTVSLSWGVYKELLKVDITYSKESWIKGNTLGRYKNDKTYAVISVINKGTRPIKITKAGYKTILDESGKGRLNVILSDSFAIPGERVLTDAKPATDFLMEAGLVNWNNVDYLWATDGRGRMYKKQIRKLPTFYKIYYKIKNKTKNEQKK